MSEQKDKEKNKADSDNNKKQLESKNCLSQKCLQICAWILLTIGLCIVVSAFYLAMQQSTACIDQVTEDAPTYEISAELQAKPSDIGEQFGFDIKEKPLKSKIGRLSLSHIKNIFGKSYNVCGEQECQITCTNGTDMYTAVDNILKASSCLSIDQLVLEKQTFPSGVLKNLWLPSNTSIHEIIIRSSNITKIKYNAFNSLLFKNTYALTLSDITIGTIQSGALLGLYNLKYLTIKGKIFRHESAILQPVQTTLMNLKLNAGLRIKGNQNPFDKSHLIKLVCLDLSNNYFGGSLGQNFFKSTPNLKYLTIAESQIESIDEDAFENLRGKLTFLNLANNKLKTLNAAVFKPIIMMEPTAISIINLANNDWLCTCDLQELTIFYQRYRQQFIDTLYCKGPHHLYGLSLEEVDYGEQNCLISSTTITNLVEVKDGSTSTTTDNLKSFTTSKGYSVGTVTENSSEKSSTETTNHMLKMRCFNMDPTDRIAYADQNKMKLLNSELDKMQFPAPNFDFELQLIAENNSVKVTIKKPSKLLLIWFSESPFIEYNDTSCRSYEVPELTVGPLEHNTTYTFCLLNSSANEISPFDCLPLHVPAKRQENIWITEDKKDFTIGMLCLIFLLSTIAGGLIAYFGIKAYPDVLEGSKNVLVVKKPDQACYVATISETEYQKQSSIKKQKLTINDKPLKEQSSIKLPLPDTPPIENSSTPIPMSVKDLERLSSLKSSSTCFEDTFPTYNFTNEEYETPKLCNNEYNVELRCVENIYGRSPKSPPPLPKRNSNVSGSPIVIMNRFLNNVE